MIKRLQIESFGKFKNFKLDFDRLNFIFGQNERGKTTLFDALADQLLKKGNFQFRKYLNRRYGEQRQVRLESNHLITNGFEPEFFFNIVAVGSLAELNLRLDFRGDWVQFLRDQIFSGGIDGKSVLSGLKKLADQNDARLAANRECKEIQKKLEEYEQRIRLREESFRQVELAAQEFPHVEKGLQQVSQKLKELETKIEEIRQELDRQELHLHYELVQGQIKELLIIEALQKKIEQLERFRRDESSWFSEFQARWQQFQIDLVRLEEKLKLLEEKRKVSLSERNRAEENCRQLKEFSCGLKTVFDDFQKKRLGLFSERLAFPLLLLVAVVSGGFFLNHKPFSAFGFLILLLFLSIIFVLQNLRRYRFFSRIKLFQNERFVQLCGKIDSFSGLSEAERILISNLAGGEEDYVRQSKQLESCEQEIDEKKQILNELVVSGEKLTKQKKDFLQKFQLERFENYELYRQELLRLDSELEQRKANLKLNNEIALEVRLRELNLKADKLVSQMKSLKKSPEEIRILKNQSEDLLRQREELLRQEAELIKKQSELKGLLVSRQSSWLEEYLQLSLEKNKLEERLRSLKLDFQGAELAARIVEELLGKQLNDFSLLIDLVKPFWKEFSERSELEIHGLNNYEIYVLDALGEKRQLPLLSKSTLDAFYLCLRLALANQLLKEPPKVIILDDPFLNFDRLRKQAGIRLLEKFCQENEFQLIYFSCDHLIKDAISSFRSWRLINLE